MTAIEDESAVIAATLRQYRRGHRLLAAYLVAAYVIVVVGVWFYRSAWIAFTGAAVVVGLTLLRYVYIGDRRARTATRERRPDLLIWPSDRKLAGVGTRATPGGGPLYVIALILVVFLSLVVRSESGAASASATTSVMIESCAPDTKRSPGACAGQWLADGAIHRGTITWQDAHLRPGAMLRGRYAPADPGTVYQDGKRYFTAGATASAFVFVVFGLIFFGVYLIIRRKFWLPMIAELGGPKLRPRPTRLQYRVDDARS